MSSQNFANPQAVGRVDTKTKTEIMSEQVTRTPDSVVVPINSLQISDDGTVTVSFTPLGTQQKQSSNIAYASSATSRATSSINSISSSVKYVLIITAPDAKTQYGVEVSGSPAQIQLDKSLPSGIYTATLRTINTIDGKQKITEASSHFSVYSDAPEQISAELVASSVTAT